MAAMTLYLQKKLLDHVLRIADYDMPAALYLGLHTGNPGEAGSRSFEITFSGSGYARADLSSQMSATDLSSGSSRLLFVMNIGPATIDWGDVSYVSIDDDPTAGNMLFYAALELVQNTPIGEQIQFAPGQIVVRLN